MSSKAISHIPGKIQREEITVNQEQCAALGEWIIPAEAAVIIGPVTKRTVEKWCRQGLLPAKQVNKRWYIHKCRLLKMLDFYKEKQSTASKGTRKHR